MKRYFLLLFAVLIGYNVFLIQRDKQLFESYNQPPQSERMQ
jgi:hypothetical protein